MELKDDPWVWGRRWGAGGGPGVWEKREYGEGDGEMKGRVGGKGEEGNGVRERSGGEMEGD